MTHGEAFPFEQFNQINVLAFFDREVTSKERDVFREMLSSEDRAAFSLLEQNMQDLVISIASLDALDRRQLEGYVKKELLESPEHHGPPGFLEIQQAFDYWKRTTHEKELPHAA